MEVQGVPFIRYARLQETMMMQQCLRPYDHRLFYCVGGTGRIRVADRSYPMQDGSLLIWKSGTPYRFVDWGDLRTVALNFDLTTAHVRFTAPIPPAQADSYDASLCLEPQAPLLSEVIWLPKAQTLYGTLARILEEYAWKRLGYEALCGALLLEVLTLAHRLVRQNAEQIAPAERVLYYIQRNVEQPLSYEQLQAELHYHPNHINRLVREQTGMSLHQYIRACRIEQAIHLLQTTVLPIGTIASRLQFADGKSFSRCFKLATGKKPSDYRGRLSDCV